jgi:hypothetical protein
MRPSSEASCNVIVQQLLTAAIGNSTKRFTHASVINFGGHATLQSGVAQWNAIPVRTFGDLRGPVITDLNTQGRDQHQ